LTNIDIKNWSLESDLTHIFENTSDIWFDFKDCNIFITGGTGFIGKWILESIKYVNNKLSYNINVTVLTRSISSFKTSNIILGNYSYFNFIEGNVTNFIFPPGEYQYIIHGATEASQDLNENDPSTMFSTILDGTRRVLDFAKDKKSKKVLFLSSGAVYGQQPPDMIQISEQWNGNVDFNNVKNTYAEAKRAAELLCSIYSMQFNIHISIARIFALLGPYLSLNIHFAAGNFIRDAICGKKIIIYGNGAPIRSYLYVSDLIIFLFQIYLNV
jgi:dTDP-glucose 4,6-dehydratase